MIPWGERCWLARCFWKSLESSFSESLSKFTSKRGIMEVLIAVGIFVLVFGVLYFTLASRAPVTEEAIQRRLDNIAAQPKTGARLRFDHPREESFWETVANFFLGSKQEMPAAYSKIGRRLHQAAYRGERAIRIFWGLRIFLGLAFSFGGLFWAFLFKASTQDVL